MTPAREPPIPTGPRAAPPAILTAPTSMATWPISSRTAIPTTPAATLTSPNLAPTLSTRAKRADRPKKRTIRDMSCVRRERPHPAIGWGQRWSFAPCTISADTSDRRPALRLARHQNRPLLLPPHQRPQSSAAAAATPTTHLLHPLRLPRGPRRHAPQPVPRHPGPQPGTHRHPHRRQLDQHAALLPPYPRQALTRRLQTQHRRTARHPDLRRRRNRPTHARFSKRDEPPPDTAPTPLPSLRRGASRRPARVTPRRTANADCAR
jgi:hypothetical protein